MKITDEQISTLERTIIDMLASILENYVNLDYCNQHTIIMDSQYINIDDRWYITLTGLIKTSGTFLYDVAYAKERLEDLLKEVYRMLLRSKHYNALNSNMMLLKSV